MVAGFVQQQVVIKLQERTAQCQPGLFAAAEMLGRRRQGQIQTRFMQFLLPQGGQMPTVFDLCKIFRTG